MQMLENGSLHGDRLRLRGLEERGRMEAKTWKAAQNITAEETLIGLRLVRVATRATEG